MENNYLSFCIAYDCADFFEAKGLACDEAYELAQKLCTQYKQYIKENNLDDCYESLQDFLNENVYRKTVCLSKVTLEDMDLSVRSYNCLKRALIDTLEDLSVCTVYDLMRIRNLNRKGLEEIIEKCKEYGVYIKTEDTEGGYYAR